jgi:hypothetical protein
MLPQLLYLLMVASLHKNGGFSYGGLFFFFFFFPRIIIDISGDLFLVGCIYFL